MLILTRRCGERLPIGADVAVTVLGVKGNQVRLGIATPREVAVDREEIAERKAAGRPDCRDHHLDKLGTPPPDREHGGPYAR